MLYLFDMIVLIAYSMLNLFFIRLDTAFIFFTLIVVILCCVEYCFTRNKILAMMLICYCVLSFICPAAFCFLPVIFYILFKRKKYSIVIVQSLVFFYIFFKGILNRPVFFVDLLGIFFAFYMYKKTVKTDNLLDTYKKNRDDSREITLLLKEKNKALIENQDYQVYTATLKERNRIARDIHDNVGHMLSRAILMTGALKTVNQQENLSSSFHDLDTTLNIAMDNIRASVHDLHDESVNLKDAVNDIIEGFTFCPVNLNYDISIGVPSDIKYSFISIIKEALSNVVRHSNATFVEITVQEHPYMYQLVISDNGTKVHMKDTGIGLANMKDRINTLKGTINFTTDSGFKIFVIVPKI